MKKIFIIFFSLILTITFFELVANFANLRPLLWKNSFYSYLNVGWYTWHGADHLYENEIHAKQTNGFLTRGKKPDNKKDKNIILLGDSTVETSNKLTEMPENYLRNFLNDTNVISFGSWGWTTDQQYLHLKKYIHKIKPKHVVLWFQISHLIGNKHKHGFLGAKPTFTLKKNKKNNYYLLGPDRLPGINYYEYSYFYRAFNKFIGLLKLKNYKSYFDYLKNCENNNSNNFVSKNELLNSMYNNKAYEIKKLIHDHYEKPYKNNKNSGKKEKYPSFEKWKKDGHDNFLIREEKSSKLYSEEYLQDYFKYNRLIISDDEREKEILTNLLLLRMQKLAEEHQASFHIMFVLLPEVFKPFKSEKVYRYCFKNRQFIYANNAFDKKLDRIFKNINNVFVMNYNYYNLKTLDLFDGHFNNEGNKFIMKKLGDYIEQFDN